MIRRLFLGALLLCAVGTRSAAAQDGYFIDAAQEISAVKIGAAPQDWHISRMAAGRLEEGRLGWTLTGERHRRGGQVDWAAAASAFRRAGDWTVSGSAGVTDRPHFLYRRFVEGELARRVAGTFVVHGGYRRLEFAHVNVRIFQPAASVYFSRGELQARMFVVRNVTLRRDTSAVLLRGTWAVRPRLRLAGGAAAGSRIFDVASLSDAGRNSRVVFVHATVPLTAAWSAGVVAVRAQEGSSFSQRTLGLSVRRTFR